MIIRRFGKDYVIGHYKPNGEWEEFARYVNDLNGAVDCMCKLNGGFNLDEKIELRAITEEIKWVGKELDAIQKQLDGIRRFMV